jgi:hypothetical protein
MIKSVIVGIFLCSFLSSTAQQQNTTKQTQKKLTLTDSLISLYQKNEHYIVKKIIKITKQDSLYYLDCFSGKSLLVLAVFKEKPLDEKGELIIFQKTKKSILKQPFLFEAAHYNESLNVYTSAVKIIYPSAANNTNCYSKISMQNEDKSNKDVYFIVLVK